MSSQISRRDIIASAVAAGVAAVPSVSESGVDFQEADNVVFITTERVFGSQHQLKQFTYEIWSHLQANGSKLVPCVLHGGAKIQFPSPYTFHEKIGNYEFAVGCRTKDELLEVVREIRNAR